MIIGAAIVGYLLYIHHLPSCDPLNDSNNTILSVCNIILTNPQVYLSCLRLVIWQPTTTQWVLKGFVYYNMHYINQAFLLLYLIFNSYSVYVILDCNIWNFLRASHNSYTFLQKAFAIVGKPSLTYDCLTFTVKYDVKIRI